METKKRQIVFKGKSLSGKWVEGAYFTMHHNDDRTHVHHFIIPDDTPIPKDVKIGDIQVEVFGESVAQFTGCLDKNGKRVFEGDLLEVPVRESFYRVGFFLESDEQRYIGDVVWNGNACRYEIRFHMKGNGICGREFGWGEPDFEVVGTMFDDSKKLTTVRPNVFGE